MKQTLLTIVTFLLAFNFVTAQITLETDYEHSGSYTQLASSGYKFYVMDVSLNQCRIYNTDHSLWKTINLDVPSGNYLYDIRYVSENLFTNDNSVSFIYIYYFYNEVYQYYTYTLKIINEDGTNLKTIEGAQYAYAINIGEAETKLTVYAYDDSYYPYSITTIVYDLPGERLSFDSESEYPSPTLNAYPNPSTDFSIVPYQLPDGIAQGEIQILDMQGKIIQTFKVDNQFDHLRISTSQFPRGTYLYRLVAGNFSSKANKLMVK